MTDHLRDLDIPQEELQLRNHARVLVAAVLVILFSSLAVIAPAELADPGMIGANLVETRAEIAE